MKESGLSKGLNRVAFPWIPNHDYYDALTPDRPARPEKVHRLQIGTVAPIVLTGALPVLILLQAVEMAAQCIL